MPDRSLRVFGSERNGALTLVLDDKDDAAIQVGARLIAPRARRDEARLSIPYRGQLIARQALRREIRLDGVSAAARQVQVVTRGAGRISEALDRDLRSRIVFLHDAREAIERSMILVANLISVEGKVDRQRELKPIFHCRDLGAEIGFHRL